MGLVVLLVGSGGLEDAFGLMATARSSRPDRGAPDHGRPGHGTDVVSDERNPRADVDADDARPGPTRLPTGNLPRDVPGGAWWRYQRPDVPVAPRPDGPGEAGRVEDLPDDDAAPALPGTPTLPARAVTQTPLPPPLDVRAAQSTARGLPTLHPSRGFERLRRGRGARRSRGSRRDGDRQCRRQRGARARAHLRVRDSAGVRARAIRPGPSSGGTLDRRITSCGA